MHCASYRNSSVCIWSWDYLPKSLYQNIRNVFPIRRAEKPVEWWPPIIFHEAVCAYCPPRTKQQKQDVLNMPCHCPCQLQLKRKLRYPRKTVMHNPQIENTVLHALNGQVFLWGNYSKKVTLWWFSIGNISVTKANMEHDLVWSLVYWMEDGEWSSVIFGLRFM